MISRKLLRHLTGVMLAIVLIGCTAPTETPIAIGTAPQTSEPTQVPTVTANPSPTPMKISSFEECYVDGWIQNTYPRQCITNNGEIFMESLGEGVIYTRTYGAAKSHESGHFITSTRDGGYLIAGSANYGCWVLKMDASGEKEWESSFEQELRQALQLYNTGFRCWLARQTPDDGYVVMGTGFDEGIFPLKPSFLITLDHDGNMVSGQIIAEKTGKIPYLAHDGNLIRLTSIGTQGTVTEAIDGGYITVSQYPERSSDSRTHMTKTDKNGNYIWDRNLCLDKNISQAEAKKVVCSHNSYNYIWDVIQLKDGSFAVTGVSNGAWLLKTDVNGNVEWIRPYSMGAGCALVQLPDESFLIAGYLHGDGLLIKTDSEGNMQWSKTFAGTGNYDIFRAMEQRPNGEITILGETSFSGTEDLWLVGLDSTLLK
ncbi:MAG TPA: hypothetical protein VK206_04080 [Anaerolineales bacterium]|nr:hypothetical protein [Anaerolineales bacterium]HLO34086.1 hypothetical protein [Anaerolineales bacterium]